MRSPLVRPTLVALALAAGSLAVPGCAGSGGAGPSRELTTAQFDDVPVPQGFALDDASGRCYSYAEGGSGAAAIRMGRLEYAGAGDPDAVLAWYESEMAKPLHGWTDRRRLAASDDGVAALFARGEDRCLVRVVREGAGTRILIQRNTDESRGS